MSLDAPDLPQGLEWPRQDGRIFYFAELRAQGFMEAAAKIAIVKGASAVVTEPIYEPKMRGLTTKELAGLNLQRDQNLDALEQIAMREVSYEPLNDEYRDKQ